MSMLRLRLVRKVNRASASVFVGNMRSDWKLERSLSNIGPGPCIGVCCDRNWENAPTSAQSDTKKGARSTRTSLRSEEHTSELQSQSNLVCRLLLEKKKILTRRSQ